MEQFNLDAFESYAKIVVIGCGGGGSNAVNQMVEEQMRGVTFWVCNTDAQALANSKAENRLILGRDVTNGLGAGGNPSIGKAAAEASIDDLYEIIQGANMVFIAAGMGGGTGTGAAPVIAKVAKNCGALTIAIVTRPFTFEGERRRKNAVNGIRELKENVDSMIIVSNDKLMVMSGTRPIREAFAQADHVLAQSVKTITDLIVCPGVINLDFADIKATLENSGVAMIGFGMGSGAKKAQEAAENALLSPLLEAQIKGAHSLIANVTCGSNVSLEEAQVAIDYVTAAAGNEPNIIFGVQENPELTDQMLISIIATEFEQEYDPLSEGFVAPIQPQVQEQPKLVKEEENDEENIIPKFLQ